jgi:hypothetical protein
MFVGHLAAGLMLKARVREASLGWLLLGTVWLDLLCGVLMAVGVERTTFQGSMIFGHAVADIGYSHSLMTSLAFAAIAAVVGVSRWKSRRVALVLALAVLSHFVLDALSHRHDMPLIGFGAERDVRLGTDLALHPLAFFLVELGWCLLAWALLDVHNRRLLVTLLVLMGLWANSIFGFAPPPPLSGEGFGVSMIVFFGIAGAAVFWAARGPRGATA